MEKDFLENALNILEKEYEYYKKELNEQYDKLYVNPPESFYLAINTIAQNDEKITFALDWWINFANFGKNKNLRTITNKKENKNIELKNNKDFVNFLIDEILEEE